MANKTVVNLCSWVVLLAPILGALIAVALSHRRRFKGSRSPQKERLLRSPGESLQQRIQVFDDAVLVGAGKILGIGIVAALAFAIVLRLSEGTAARPLWLAVYVCALAALVAVVSIVIYRRVDRHWCDLIGYRGERAVGQELNQLMLQGCHVFHDVPGNGPWNIDHVVVTPRGVFALETKTRRKGRKRSDGNDHIVVFDGAKLEFPSGPDTFGLEQVRRNAEWLAKWLSSVLAEPIKAFPVLVLPGWWIDGKVKPFDAGVAVLNTKGFATFSRNVCVQEMSDKQIKQIAAQLDQRCRDVEF